MPLTLPARGLSANYIFTFDLASDDSTLWPPKGALDRLGTFVAAFYAVGHSETRYSPTAPLLDTYRTEMYEQRFKASVLATRTSILLELPAAELHGLAHSHQEIVSGDHIIQARATLTLNQMGVASLVLWLDLAAMACSGTADLKRLRDVELLTTTVDWRLGPSKSLRLSGAYSLTDLARFAILSVYSSLYPRPRIRSLSKKLAANENLADLHRLACAQSGDDPAPSHEIHAYPIIHIDFTSDPSATGAAVAAFVNDHASCLRGIATGDANWDKKRSDVVANFMAENSFSTRNSIFWLTHSEGSIKLYSKELETPVLTSQVLITFELEIILTMKHFVHRIIRNLDYFSDGSRPGRYALRSLTRLRDREMRRLDEYYNLDFLQKDTTVARLGRFHAIFAVDALLQMAIKKFENLNAYMATEFQNASAKRQLALSVIFGIFGAGNLVFNGIRKAVEDKLIPMPFTNQLLWTVAAMAFVALLIMATFGRTRMR